MEINVDDMSYKFSESNAGDDNNVPNLIKKPTTKDSNGDEMTSKARASLHAGFKMMFNPGLTN